MEPINNETRSCAVLVDRQLRATHQTIYNDEDTRMLNFQHINHKHLSVAFITPDGIKRMVRGRVAQTIAWLCDKQEYGITALEMSSWALRLSAYIHILRHKHGLTIHTVDEPHDGGIHARYVLVDMVEIVKVTDRRR